MTGMTLIDIAREAFRRMGKSEQDIEQRIVFATTMSPGVGNAEINEDKAEEAIQAFMEIFHMIENNPHLKSAMNRHVEDKMKGN